MLTKISEAAKAYSAGVIAFLGFVASKGVDLPVAVEGFLIFSLAAVSVYIVPNFEGKE